MLALEEARLHLGSARAISATDPLLGKRLDSARRRRNRSEYGAAFFDAESIADAIDLAESLIGAVESEQAT